MKCVKIFTLTAVLFLSMAPAARAQTNATTPTVVAVTAPAAPVAEATPMPTEVVPEPAAPPKWAQDVIVSAEKLPVVGPYVSKALLYLGILSSILTAGVAFLLTLLSALSGAFNLAGLASFATKVQIFRDGKIMYWLKYLSMFNAKPAVPTVAKVESAPTEQKMAA